jgi:hypothetical protein
VRNNATDLLHVMNTGLLKVLTNGAEFTGNVNVHGDLYFDHTSTSVKGNIGWI